MFKRDLEFLLKEKYGYSDTEIFLEKGLPLYVKRDIELLNKGYPVDYLIGYKWFLNVKIDLSKKPLIPRNETEYWVEKCINKIPQNADIINVLDIFCGSGCIGLAILKHLPNTFVTFSDIAKKGYPFYAVESPSERRHKVIRSNLFEKMKRAKFDYIFANPPYVDPNDPLIGAEIKYEPKAALFANDNGMEIIKKFLAEAYKHLLPQGKIFMEFGYNQKDLIDEYLKSLNTYNKWQFHKDQYRTWRWVEIA